MKHAKTCPKCTSTDIYTDTGKVKRGDRTALQIGNFSWFFMDVYVCLDCGFTEEYVQEKDLKDAKNLATIKKNWAKIG